MKDKVSMIYRGNGRCEMYYSQRTSKRERNGVPNFSRTWLISKYNSFDWKSGRQRLKIECATCSTPTFTAGSVGDNFETRS